ncbi:hypothetical protein BJ170DRAFT_605687 [Xylariales sp. AK1849]|nr:hypothetical protein BJ170DRAFT_605687 [Xylariales sp. AK1849]
MANTTPSTTTTYGDVWPEYPEPTYWHDLINTGEKRPFYAYARCQPIPPPVFRSKDQLEEDRRFQEGETAWIERQLHWYNVGNERLVGPGDAAQNTEEEPGVSLRTCTRISAKIHSVIGGLRKVKDLVKYDFLDVLRFAFSWLHRLVVIGAIICMLVLLGIYLVESLLHGKRGEWAYVPEYEYVLAQKYRSWAVAQHDRTAFDGC